MLVFDAVIYNEDRHFGNFGVLRDNRTGKIISPAPIFDNGLSLINYAMNNDIKDLDSYCPPVFGIEDGKLYMFLNQMASADHMHSLDLYIYDEGINNFERPWSRPIPFKLNTNIYEMSNGKLIMPGRIAELDGFSQIPAVMISDRGKINSEWQIVKITDKKELPDNSEFIHPEVFLILNDNKIYAFCRNDQRKVPIIFLSYDFGESWHVPYVSDVPFPNSKIYSGTLSSGRNYAIGNVDPNREKTVLFLSVPAARFCLIAAMSCNTDFPMN